MYRFRWLIALWLAAFLVAPPGAWAQRGQFGPREPRIGYLYPAGGRQGVDFEVTLGGQYLNGATGAYVSGEGVQVTVGKYVRPLNPKEINQLREKIQEARKRVQAEMKKAGRFSRRGNYRQTFAKLVKEMGVSAEDMKALDEFRKLRTDPKRQLNPQLDGLPDSAQHYPLTEPAPLPTGMHGEGAYMRLFIPQPEPYVAEQRGHGQHPASQH